jgi:hypothetical protein
MALIRTAFRNTGLALGLGLCVYMGGCASMSSSNTVSLTEIDKVFLQAAGSWDLNRDDIVTCVEWATYGAQLFDAADKGKKGFVTPQEFERIAGTDHMFKVANFKYYDADKDGKVTRSEFIDKVNPAFFYADKDKDCKLTTEEMQMARTLGRSDTAPKPMIVPPPSTTQTH